MNRGAQWATVHRVTKSQTWLSNSHILDIINTKFTLYKLWILLCFSEEHQLKFFFKQGANLPLFKFQTLSPLLCAAVEISIQFSQYNLSFLESAPFVDSGVIRDLGRVYIQNLWFPRSPSFLRFPSSLLSCSRCPKLCPVALQVSNTAGFLSELQLLCLVLTGAYSHAEKHKAGNSPVPFSSSKGSPLLGLLAFCHSPIHLGTYLCFVQFIIVSCGKVSLMGTAAQLLEVKSNIQF